MTRILIAHPSAEVFALIKEELEAVAVDELPEIGYTRNRLRALQLIRQQRHDLLIAYIDLAEDRGTSPVKRNGLELVQAVGTGDVAVPCILIAACAEHDVASSVHKIEGARLVIEGGNFLRDLVREVRAGLADAHPVSNAERPQSGEQRRAVERMTFVIDIRLRRDGHCDYTSRSRGGRAKFEKFYRFEVAQADIDELIELSRNLSDDDKWNVNYRALGKKLRTVLLGGDPVIRDDINQVRGMLRLENPESIPAIRFIVDAGVHRIALEALDDDANDDYWLQRAPIWRQLDLRITQLPLFHDDTTRDGAVNCLIVEAAASGLITDLGVELEPLPAVPQEAMDLEKFLRGHKDDRIGKIARIRRDHVTGEIVKSFSTALSPDATEERVADSSFRVELGKLLRGPDIWHIVHYAGHSHYDEKLDCGYVILPGETPEVVGTSELAPWLSRSQFVYMSSCRGSSQDFVFNLCKFNVAAVAGFRWNIADKMAREHSKTFYQELLDRRSLQDAFVETWKHMYGTYRLDRVWTTPQLIMQLAA